MTGVTSGDFPSLNHSTVGAGLAEMLHLNFTVVFLYTVWFEKLRIVGGKTSVKKRKIN